ncbi:extracellular solute-binding protein [candidate division KSB3 bacterium]|uniref:Extracellular solute-binding protein n=1 Tax=candidate division KSB3 bacterium TaxID=2044937 RepID=A0A9D5JY68_9BACT|nr:extracellular solute-binding protein [candidate division KSB3 bacterium]MBD3326343.1 extracellular solute-binding protein [candidate division KSB3 bacterium]
MNCIRNTIRHFAGLAVFTLILVGLSLTVHAQGEGIWYGEQPEWAQGVEELTVFNLGEVEYDPAITELALAFEALTGIHVNIYPAPSATLLEEASRSLSLGEGTYDVLDFPPSWTMPDWVDAGWIVPLDDVIPARMRDQWYESLIPSTMKDGKTYFIRHQVEVRMLMYRQDLAEDAGYSEPPKDWDELVDLAKKLTVDTDGDGNIDQWGYAYSASPTGETILETFGSFLNMAGGKLWNDDGTAAFNSPEGEAALQFMVDLVHKHKVTPPGVITYREGQMSDMISAGAVAMAEMDNSLMQRTLSTDPYGPNIAVTAPIARQADMEPGEDIFYQGKGIAYCVNKNSEHVEAAKRLAVFVGGYMSNWFEGAVELNFPANQEVLNSPYLQGRIPFFAEQMKVAQASREDTHSDLPLIQDILARGVTSAIQQERTPKEALDWMVEEMERQQIF